jgi:hypothetical protein
LALIQRFAALALAARKVDEGDLAHLHGTAACKKGDEDGRRRRRMPCVFYDGPFRCVCAVRFRFPLLP